MKNLTRKLQKQRVFKNTYYGGKITRFRERERERERFNSSFRTSKEATGRD